LLIVLDKRMYICYKIVMYITEIPTKTKSGKLSHLCILLRESYYDKGRVRNRTLANLTHCKPEEIKAMRLALKHKGNLTNIRSISNVSLTQGKSAGAVWLVYQIAKRLGIEQALGKSRPGKLALWQVISRVIDQGSRLSSVRLAGYSIVGEVLGLKKSFNEDDLYRNQEWITKKQDQIERHLFKSRHRKVNLFLYDVTSSYLEGEKNELSNWGYNRDKKRNKKQIVIGLLCDELGEPVSIKVYKGNTQDTKTFKDQIIKTAKQFNCKRVTFVGDRGMIKSTQIKSLSKAGFNYITAITKSQIIKLATEDILQLSLFENDICEVTHNKKRYVLRKNPIRAKELKTTRRGKKEAILQLVNNKNQYLKKHKRAYVKTALKEIRTKITKLKINSWFSVTGRGRKVFWEENYKTRKKEEALDGCYVIKTDLPSEIDKKIIHDRYKDLTKVERAFRTCKTELLELRPWFVTTKDSTRAHALVVMLSYIIVRFLKKKWAKLNLTVEEGLKQLTILCSTKITVKETTMHKIPVPTKTVSSLLKKAEVKLPVILPDSDINIVSRKKLQSERS
jgi:transposase